MSGDDLYISGTYQIMTLIPFLHFLFIDQQFRRFHRRIHFSIRSNKKYMINCLIHIQDCPKNFCNHCIPPCFRHSRIFKQLIKIIIIRNTTLINIFRIIRNFGYKIRNILCHNLICHRKISKNIFIHRI